MTPPQYIDVEIDENGTVKATVLGIEGPSCEAVSKFLDAMGDVAHDSKTEDFNKRPVAQKVKARK